MPCEEADVPLWDGPEAENEDDYPVEVDETVTCAQCGAEFHELSSVCPRCGHWRTGADRRQKRPLWWILAVVITAAALILLYVL